MSTNLLYQQFFVVVGSFAFSADSQHANRALGWTPTKCLGARMISSLIMGPQHEEEEQQQTQTLDSLLLSCPGHAVKYFSIYTEVSTLWLLWKDEQVEVVGACENNGMKKSTSLAYCQKRRKQTWKNFLLKQLCTAHI